MNQRIFELSKQADLIQWNVLPSGARTPDHESVVKAIKFAELIAAAEREACAKLCEATTGAWTETVYNGACMACAAAIRARGESES